MQLTEQELKTRKELIETASKIGARTERILGAIKKSGDEDLQLKILQKYLVHLEVFDRRNFIYAPAN